MDYKFYFIVILALTQLLTITVKALVNRNKPKMPVNPGHAIVDYSGDIKECKEDIQRVEGDIKKHGERLASMEQAIIDLRRNLNKQ